MIINALVDHVKSLTLASLVEPTDPTKDSFFTLFFLCIGGTFAIMLANVFLGFFCYDALIIRLGFDGDIALLMTSLMYLSQGLVMGVIVRRALKKKAEKKTSLTVLSQEYSVAKSILSALIRGYKKQ